MDTTDAVVDSTEEPAAKKARTDEASTSEHDPKGPEGVSVGTRDNTQKPPTTEGQYGEEQHRTSGTPQGPNYSRSPETRADAPTRQSAEQLTDMVVAQMGEAWQT